MAKEFIDFIGIRKMDGQTQTQFWGEFGLTQSAGCRYEAGRDIPEPLNKLLRLREVGVRDFATLVDLVTTVKAEHGPHICEPDCPMCALLDRVKGGAL